GGPSLSRLPLLGGRSGHRGSQLLSPHRLRGGSSKVPTPVSPVGVVYHQRRVRRMEFGTPNTLCRRWNLRPDLSASLIKDPSWYALWRSNPSIRHSASSSPVSCPVSGSAWE